MAFPIPPWIAQHAAPNPAEAFISQLHTGAQIGLESARMGLEADQQANQLRMAQQRMQQEQSNLAAKLSADQQMAQLEWQSRMAIADQANQQRQQKMLIDQAIKQEQLGIAQDRVDVAASIAEAKARDSAQSFADTAAFAQEVAAGVDIPTALSRHPRTHPTDASLLQRHMDSRANQEDVDPTVFDIGQGFQASQTARNHYQILPKDKLPTMAVPMTSDPSGPKITGPMDNPAVQAALRNNPTLQREFKRQQAMAAAAGQSTNLPAPWDLTGAAAPKAKPQSGGGTGKWKEGDTLRYKDGSIWKVEGGKFVMVRSAPIDESDSGDTGEEPTE